MTSSTSSVSAKETLYRCSIELHSINKARRSFKEVSDINSSKDHLKALSKQCDKLSKQMVSIFSKVDSSKSSSLKKDFVLLRESLQLQQHKLKKILGASSSPISSPASSKAPSEKSDHSKGSKASGSKHATSKPKTSAPYPAPTIKPCFLKDFPNIQDPKEAKKAVLKKVWNDTLEVLKHGRYTNSKGQIVRIDTRESVQKTRLYQGVDSTEPVHNDGKPQEMLVIGQDCLNVAHTYVGQGYKVGLLNMASDQTPGGGVRKQTNAQEEQVFQRSGAVDPLSTPALQGKQKTNYYPLSKVTGTHAGGLFSPKVPVFRHGFKEGYAVMDEPFSIDLLTVAAFKNPSLSSTGKLKQKELDGTKDKIRTMLQMAYDNGDQVVILSAFGCGAYHNPPAHIAQLFQEVIDQYYPSAFEKIIFAIIDDSNAPQGGNFMPFARHFGQQGAKVYDRQGKELSATDLAIGNDKDHKAKTGSSSHQDAIKEIQTLAKKGVVQFFDKALSPTTCFLSGFYPCKVKFDGLTYECAEAAFHAGRDPKKKKEFVGKDGLTAFNHRRNILSTKDWPKRSEKHLEEVLFAKFTQNSELKKKLLATGNAYLVMHTDKDNHWGDGGKIGSANHYGKVLMKVRERLGGKGVVKLPSSYKGGET